MKQLLILLFLGCLLVETYWLRPSQSPPTKVPPQFGLWPQKGVIHVHSTNSDGGGTVLEIVAKANHAKLDFLVLTDHNNAMGRRQGREHRHGATDLYVEMEASTPAGHLLTFFTLTQADQFKFERVRHLSYQHFLGKPSPPGFFTFLAHPRNLKRPFTTRDRWTEGMEVINFDSVWQHQATDNPLSFLLTAFVYPLNNYLGVMRFFDINRDNFGHWDAMNAFETHHTAILAHDTHSRTKLTKRWIVRWPDYDKAFRIASNMVLLKNPPRTEFIARKKQIYQAIRKNRIAMVFDYLHPYTGNHWELLCENERFIIGDIYKWDGRQKCSFIAKIPDKFPYPITFKLWKDGHLWKEGTGKKFSNLPLEVRGTYRLELFAEVHTPFRLFLNKQVPYLFYNPIYVQ